MSVEFQSEFPQACDSKESNIAFYLAEQNILWLVYEAKRDFLSAPRCFVILSASVNANQLATGGAFLSESEWEAVNIGEFGVYKIPESEHCQSSIECHWVCSTPLGIVEFFSNKLELDRCLYHHASPHLALRGVLADAR